MACSITTLVAAIILNVGAQRLARTDRAIFAFLQKAQKFGLQARPKLADLVEKKRPAGGLAHESVVRLLSAGERPAHVTKQLAFEQGLGKIGAVHRYHRSAGARTRGMDRVGKQFLPRAALAQQQHRRFEGCYLPGLGDGALEHRGYGDDIFEFAGRSRRARPFAALAPASQPLQQGAYIARSHRQRKKINRSRAQGFDLHARLGTVPDQHKPALVKQLRRLPDKRGSV